MHGGTIEDIASVPHRAEVHGRQALRQRRLQAGRMHAAAALHIRGTDLAGLEELLHRIGCVAASSVMRITVAICLSI